MCSLPKKKNSSKQRIRSSQVLRDLSQVVRCTPWHTPVPLYTRTSPWPINSPKTFGFAFVLILIGQMIFRIHVDSHRYFTPIFTFALAFVILKVINSEIIYCFASLWFLCQWQIFFWRPLRDNRPRDEPPPIPGTNGTKWWFYCWIKQKNAGLSQARLPICPGQGSHLSLGRFLFVPECHCPAQNVYVYWLIGSRNPLL